MCTVLLPTGVNPIAVNKYINIIYRMWGTHNGMSRLYVRLFISKNIEHIFKCKFDSGVVI